MSNNNPWNRAEHKTTVGKVIYTTKSSVFVGFEDLHRPRVDVEARLEGHKWCVQLHGESPGSFEHDEQGEGGSITTTNGEVTDYDGCYDLPQEVKDTLKAMGYKGDIIYGD